MLIASGLLALLIGAAFAVLLSSVADLRTQERRARRSEEVLEVANLLERQVDDRHGCVAMCKELFPQLDAELDAWAAEHGWLYR